jgi:hypothetical protein
MKRKGNLSILLAAVLLFTTVFTPMKSFAQEDSTQIIQEGIKDGHKEFFYDESGNKTELEYLINDEEFRINTYFNDELVDYTTRQALGDGTYSDKIIYNKVLEINPNNTSLTIDDNEPITFNEVNEVEEYIVSDFIKEEITPLNTTLPGTYFYITSKYNSLLDIYGYLYRASDSSEIKKFMFDFKRDTAISVVASAITFVFSTAVVAVLVLLAALGASYSFTMLTDSLNGWYDATRKRYSYQVKVNNQITYQHNQEQVNVLYYNSKNGKQDTRETQSGSWMSEDAILNVGIISGS